VDVGNEEFVKCLFFVGFAGQGSITCTTVEFVAQVITQLQERVESERTVQVEKMKKERRLGQSMTEELDIAPGVALPRKLAPGERLIGCDVSVSDFWAWAYSDLILNIDRAVFAEFIVGCALEVTKGTRRTWDCADHEYRGKKIEVKATGYAQRWRQGKKRSPLSFDIAKKVCIPWGEPDAPPDAPAVRSADCYVFCVHTETDSKTANPVDLSKWDFIIMSTVDINRIFGGQKTVSLSVLEKHCSPVKFEKLRRTVDECIGKQNSV
jgi:hypothetical protein